MNRDSDAVTPPPHSIFDEEWYLSRYADVAAAVRSGKFRSGWHHFQACGKAEGRDPARPGQFRINGLAGPLSEGMVATRLAMQILLGRDEWNEDTIGRYADFHNVDDLRKRICASAEYQAMSRLREIAHIIYHDEEKIRQDSEEFDKFLKQPSSVEENIEALVREAARTGQYAAHHQHRFYDQLKTVLSLRNRLFAARPTISLLDIGQAPVTLMYKKAVQGIDLYTANQPFGGDAEAVRREYGSIEHFFIDFEREPISKKFPMLRDKPFDIIMFCEVIEHVRASPAEQIGDLLSILSDHGVLVLTTPNALSLRHLRPLARPCGRNPSYACLRIPESGFHRITA